MCRYIVRLQPLLQIHLQCSYRYRYSRNNDAIDAVSGLRRLAGKFPDSVQILGQLRCFFLIFSFAFAISPSPTPFQPYPFNQLLLLQFRPPPPASCGVFFRCPEMPKVHLIYVLWELSTLHASTLHTVD